MKMEEIKQIVQILRENDLSSIELCEGDFSLKITARGAAEPAVPAPAAPAGAAAPAPAVESSAPTAESAAGHTLKSPMVGIFYAAASPDSAPFVEVGSAVKKGDVVCIIEAMKLMNEITAERDGVIAEVLAENGQVVEFSQPLFRIV